MIHASRYQPRIYPINGLGSPAEIDRAQSINPSVSLNRTKVEEIGNANTVGFTRQSPSVTYALTQLEYGSMEFWRKITNKVAADNTILLSDFQTPTFDIASFLTDDDGTYRGTLWYPGLRCTGFGINVGDPDATIERNFDFIGESAITWQGANKYVIYKEHDAGAGALSTIDLSANVPAIDPDISVIKTDAEKYLIRVMRIRSGVSTELDLSVDVVYSAITDDVTVADVVANDVFKVWHTSAIAPATIFTPNLVDSSALSADSVSIYLFIPGSGSPSASDFLFRMQSISMDVSFDREDKKELGNTKVVQRGVNTNTVSIGLSDILEKFTVGEALRGEVAGYGKIDVEQLTDKASIIVKVFDDSSKTNFKYGFRADTLSPVDVSNDAGVNAYVTGEKSIEGDNLTITTDNTLLGNL